MVHNETADTLLQQVVLCHMYPYITTIYQNNVTVLTANSPLEGINLFYKELPLYLSMY